MKRFFRLVAIVIILCLCVQLAPVTVTASSGTEPIIGEIRIFAGNFAPKGWALCNGQILPIAQNTALFSLLGTTYGGDGKSTFALPDLNGKSAIGVGQGPGLSPRYLGENVGSETVTLLTSEMPSHEQGSLDLHYSFSGTASLLGTTSKGNVPVPYNASNLLMANAYRNERVYSTDMSALVDMKENNIQFSETNVQADGYTSTSGSSQPHNNRSPYLALNYIIALQGIFPSRDTPFSTPYVGEIKMFAGAFVPGGYAACDGQLLQISEYDTLFNLIGTIYGGDGQSTFAVPDLRGRTPIGTGLGTGLSTNRILGEMGGAESVTLTMSQIPSHIHSFVQQTQTIHKIGSMAVSGSPGNSPLAQGNYLAVGSRNERLYSTGLTNANMKNSLAAMNLSLTEVDASVATGVSGGSMPHDNMKPALTINYIISLYGIYPTPDGGSSDDYMAMLSMFAFNFVPGGFAPCSGQFLPINQNQALFSLLGTTYGGDGMTNFALPDLRGRMAIHFGFSRPLGEKSGEESHTLTLAEMPAHNHLISKSAMISGSATLKATNAIGNSAGPLEAVLARGLKNERIYSNSSNNLMQNAVDIKIDALITPKDGSGNLVEAPGSINLAARGGSQPHENMQPYTPITFAIALQGIFPSPN